MTTWTDSAFFRERLRLVAACDPRRAFRSLSSAEIARLRHQWNHCRDWAGIRVVEDFVPEQIHGCQFGGRCVLGRFSGETVDAGGATLPDGLYHSTLIDAVIGDGALVHRCPVVAGYVIDEGAVVQSTRVIQTARSYFGNGVEVKAGLENGGRLVLALADIDLASAEAMAGGTGVDRDLVAAYLKEAAFDKGYIGRGVRVLVAGTVRDSFIGSGVEVDGADLVDNSTLLGTEAQPTRVTTSSVVRDSIVQPGATVSDGSLVVRSVLLETAAVGHQAKVFDSVVGPNVVVAEGEVNASFVGPFVGFHHQSLLIAAFWPEGRGTVGQGANVGSNHTSRAPDQELWPGEGMFFGLGCNIKYPANYRKAPYTVIATGVTTLPQVVEFPFSLISRPVHPADGVPEAFNQLVPAWGLRDNLYALWRNESKFRRRNRSPAALPDQEILRPKIVKLIIDAMDRLSAAGESRLYLQDSIPGLGKNFMTEDDRSAAVECYRFHARRACIRHLLWLDRDPDFDPLCARLGLDRQSRRALVDELLDGAARVLRDTKESRAKDFERGIRIIPDYASTHPSVEADEVVVELASLLDRERNAVLAGMEGP